jgi:hypothetical protein
LIGVSAENKIRQINASGDSGIKKHLCGICAVLGHALARLFRFFHETSD